MAALPYVTLYLIIGVAATLLGAYVWQRRYYRSGRPLALLLAAIAWWMGCRALAVASTRFEATLFWSLMQFGGITPIMPAWLLLALSFAGHPWRRRPGFVRALFLPATVFFLIAITNSFHGLWWPVAEPDYSRGFLWVREETGPLFWAHAVYAYGCFVAGCALLATTAARAEGAERAQGWLLLAAAVLPAAGNLLFLGGVLRIRGDDPTPLLLFAGAVAALFATVHFRVVDLSPLVAREALAALPDGMVVVDNRRRVAEINRAAAAILAVEPRQAIGQPLAALLADQPLGAALRPVLGNLARPAAHRVGYDDGAALRTVELLIRPLLAENGAMAGAMLILRDVSERARSEQAQAQHLAELSLITRVARAANSAADAEGLLRAVAGTIADAGVWDRVAVGLLNGDGRQIHIAADIAADGGRTNYEGAVVGGGSGAALVAMLHDGKSRTLDLSNPVLAATPLGAALAAEGLSRLQIVPLYHQGAPLGLLALGTLAAVSESPALLGVAETVAELITDAVVRARLYDEARQAERLKALFLASVSHELRTPLTSIIGYVEMLQKGVYGTPDEPMREPLGYMRQSSQTLLRMINDILDFSRAEAGHLRVELQPVDLLHTVANVVGQLRPQIAERGLEFSFDVPPGLPLVRANPVRLEQVVLNLLSNALKFTEAGRVSLRAWSDGESVHLSVADTGVGIAPEHQELIFQEFRRVETVGRRVGGTGLGLAISRRLLALMGGAIQVESAVGAGSTFTITLRAAAVEPPPEQAAPADQLALGA